MSKMLSTNDIINHVHNEDCLATMARMEDCFVDLVVTSPPYDDMREYGGSDFTEFESIVRELYRVMKVGGVVVWVVGDQTKNGNESGTSFRHALFFKEVGFNLFDTMIYAKKPRGACGSNKTYWQAFEYMFVFSKDGEPKTINLIKDRENKDKRDGDISNKRIPNGELIKVKRAGYEKYGRRTNIWLYNIGKGHHATDEYAKEHPATFPERLARDHIISWSEKGDLIYDPFLGSGTTAKVAIQEGRNYIGSELSKDYCDLAHRRIKDATSCLFA